MRVIFHVRYACKSRSDDSVQPNHEIEILSGHENDVNYVQLTLIAPGFGLTSLFNSSVFPFLVFMILSYECSGCAVASRFSSTNASKEDCIPKFKNSWFNHDNIVTCSRDGSAII